MPRRLRIKENGYYHIINRGVEKRKVFLDNSDHTKFLDMVKQNQITYKFLIHAYCLMDNHYHFLMEIKHKNLSQIMQKLNHGYSVYFNKKNKRVGHLWQGRYKSWAVLDDQYFSTLVRYIEQNPVRAGITKKVGEYPWSSSTTIKKTKLTKNEILALNIFHNAKLKTNNCPAPE